MSPNEDTPALSMPKLPDAPTNAPVFGMSSTAGKKPKPKSPTAAYLGPNASPSVANAGYKALTGQ